MDEVRCRVELAPERILLRDLGTARERVTTVCGRFASPTTSQRVPPASRSTFTTVEDRWSKNHAITAEARTKVMANHQKPRLLPIWAPSSAANVMPAIHHHTGTH